MKERLSHFSAAKMWDIPCIETILGFKFEETDITDFTVSEQGARFLNDDEKLVHSCGLALPTGAVTNRKGKAVSSPELLFVELACRLDIHRLILLGLQLCSHRPGHPSEAITTKQKLTAFLAETPKHWGRTKALRAVKYVENGSASIMESIAYMILTLPHALGGYGLGGAVFNHEIKLKSEARTRLGQNRCFTDLYYSQAKLAVEYDSFTHHSSPSEQGRDILRSAMLERLGIDVMHLSTIQLYNKDACREFVYNLAARLGKRIQIRTKKFEEMHALIRALLPKLPNEKPASDPTANPAPNPKSKI